MLEPASIPQSPILVLWDSVEPDRPHLVFVGQRCGLTGEGSLSLTASTSQSRGMALGQETEGVSQAAGSRQGGRDVERSDVPPR